MEPKLEITNLISPILSALKLASNEIKSLLDIGIPEYLQNQTDKYYFTNSFLHRAEKVRFDKVYFPVTVNYNHLNTKFEKIDDVFDEYKCITLIGTAGSGKSTLIKYIFLSSIRQSYKIPVLIELRHLNDYQGSLIDFVFNKLLVNQIKPSGDTLERALKKGAFIFLFDGYDEIFSKSKQKIANELDNLVDKYPENKYLITTRPGGGIEGVSRFHSFLVQDLSYDEILKFIDLLVDNEERRVQIKSNVNESEALDYRDYLKNPLLLSMFILAFESHPEIPNRKSSFYKNVFDTLYSKHDGITKGSFPREKKTKLKREDFEEVLSAFSFTTIADGTYAFTEEYLSAMLNLIREKKRNIDFEIEDIIFDFRTSISIMIKEGFEYKFPHRSMQEYFTALFLSKLPSSKKEKAYKRLHKIFVNLSEDRSLNFWGLCKELDSDNYIRFFVIPELKKAHDTLFGKTGEELLNEFYKLWTPKFYVGDVRIESKNLKKSDVKELKIFRMANLYGVLVDYEEVYDYKEFCYFTNKEKIKDEILELYFSGDKNRKKSIRDFVTDVKVKKILIEHGIVEIIHKYIDKLGVKIEELNSLLEQSDDDLDDILDS